MITFDKLRRILVIAIIAALMIAAMAFAASAQSMRNCAPRDIVIQRLANGFGETRQSMGLGANNSVVEVFASLESGTWSITMTSPSGLMCLVATGQAFEALAEALPLKDDDA
ncbi:hypothetical protein ASD8599_01744 [Ascidiaceihabitans donghaensis]|uniref:Transmembrane protein n=1 Tax=Ascidiaceihabitans donghaensis TaxID=1510460 RepID=A0A2R8BD86_9RHOB|nr:hypothetical protein ASD8599_01744 [Ascidiaceihabitans donghaensis]